jgi:hypothetical protein
MQQNTRMYGERVCVVMTDMDIEEAALRRLLGDSLPLRLVPWHEHNYLAILQSLRPRVIVVAAASEQLARESALLLLRLVSQFSPTIVITAADEPRLVLQSLGMGTAVTIGSLDNLSLE